MFNKISRIEKQTVVLENPAQKKLALDLHKKQESSDGKVKASVVLIMMRKLGERELRVIILISHVGIPPENLPNTLNRLLRSKIYVKHRF